MKKWGYQWEGVLRSSFRRIIAWKRGDWVSRDPRYSQIGSSAKVQSARPQGRRLLLPQSILCIPWLGNRRDDSGAMPAKGKEGDSGILVFLRPE